MPNEYTPFNSVASKNHQVLKRNVRTSDNLNTSDQSMGKNIRTNQLSLNSNHGNVRSLKNQIDNCSKDYHGVNKLYGEFQPKNKNYSTHTDGYSKGSTSNNHQDYKPRNNNNTVNANLPQSRYTNQSTTCVQQQQQQQVLQRNCNNLTTSGNISSRNDITGTAPITTTSVTTVNHNKALEQHNLVPKMGQINFPPLRAPQSIVNVRHPFLTEARMKQQNADIGAVNINNKQKSSVASSLQNSVKELEHNRQTYHGYSGSPIANIPNVQNLANITSIAQYPRPDSFPQQTLASVLFPESSQFPQSPPYATPQLGQINQFQAYDPASFTPTPVNVNPVIPQFSAESPLPYPQFDSTHQFVQTNHYPTADMANGQYQYQAASVGQITDSPLFIQSLQSPLTLADQYAAPNYAQALRTELIPRLRRPPRFNK